MMVGLIGATGFLIKSIIDWGMRRTPYTDRSQLSQNSGLRLNNQNAGLLLFEGSFKPDLTKFNNNIAAYLPATAKSPRHHLYSRASRSVTRRPLTVNKTYGDLKPKKQEKELLSRSNNDLWVSTFKDVRRSELVRDPQLIKGRLYRGTSYKSEDRKNTAAKDLRGASRYSHTSRLTNNLTPTSREQRTSIKQDYRTSSRGGISDLIDKNVRETQQKLTEKVKQTKVGDFFQYVMRFSYRTKKGIIPSNPNKVNQDAYIINPNIQNKTFQHLFGICDGHGPLGHHVSGFIKNHLPSAISGSKNLQKSTKQTLSKAFESTYRKLIKQSQIDLSFSGSTVITVYFWKDKLYCCNVGDSRAILGQYRTADKRWGVVELSQDHKPSLPRQAERIKKMNGRIEAYRDQRGDSLGPLRVWVKNENIPGLAMSRSFGDLVGASVGVSPIPEIKQITLTQQDRIILIASDGVFEFLDNKKLIDQLTPFYQTKQIQQASDHLLSLASRSWTQNSSIVDDITFILIFLNYNQL